MKNHCAVWRNDNGRRLGSSKRKHKTKEVSNALRDILRAIYRYEKKKIIKNELGNTTVYRASDDGRGYALQTCILTDLLCSVVRPRFDIPISGMKRNEGPDTGRRDE